MNKPRPRGGEVDGALATSGGVPGMLNSWRWKSSLNLMEVKSSKAQGRHREVWSRGSVEQKREPMYKNRI